MFGGVAPAARYGGGRNGAKTEVIEMRRLTRGGMNPRENVPETACSIGEVRLMITVGVAEVAEA